MKIKYVSDIHLEFSRFPVLEDHKEFDAKSEDILLVAGDTILSVGLKEKRTDRTAEVMQWRFEEFLKEASKFKAVYMIAGNHEAYGYGDISTNKELIQDFINRKGFTNVKFLEKERIPLTEKTDLLATTLWFDGGKRNPNFMYFVNDGMNDFRVCNYKGNPFTVYNAVDLFEESVDWLKKELIDTSKDYVVMTHHCPSHSSIDPNFKGDPLNYGYASDLDDFILSHQHITHWIHGHTHYNVDYKIGKTKILGHMRGYPHDYKRGNHSGFKLNKWFEVK